MFCFGFAGLFVVIQMHGLRLSRSIRGVFLATYVIGVLCVFSDIGLGKVHQIMWIPIADYVAVFVIAFLVWGTMKLFSLFTRRPLHSSDTGDEHRVP